jgi:hypothetical protein
MQGSFSEQSLKQYEELIGEIASVNFSELNSDVYDFTRCVRADGTVYGSRGKCRKGREAAAAVVPSQAPRKNTAEKLESPKQTPTKVKAPVPAPVATPEVRTVKKSKATPLTAEEKVEKKWLSQKDKLDAIKAEHAKMTAEVEAQGHKVYATGTGASMLHRMAKERGIATPAQLSSMRIKLSQQEPERIKKERLAEEEKKRLSEIAGTTREQRKGMVRERIEELKKSKYLDTLKDVNNNVEMMKRWIQEDLSRDTLKNRVALTAMRAFRAQMAREARLEREEKYRSLDEFLKESPKYHRTSGSREPMKAKYDGNGPPRQRLEKIYEAQGFNAKPELVRSRSDLEKRKDILREPDGRPLILYRGVSEESFARQFQGSGPVGHRHYPGLGVYGNGTYAASAGGNQNSLPKNGNFDQTAQRTASSYAGGGRDLKDRVTAFALRWDANIVQFEGANAELRGLEYIKWSREIRKQASEKFGTEFHAYGEAAAAMGIHAYRVPMSSDEDYWVILNRGAVIAAQDSQVPDL